MARTTGPILALGGLTLLNNNVLHHEEFDGRIPVATFLAAGVFALGEKAAPELFVGLAWVAFVAVAFTRLRPNVPAPAESLAAFLGATPGAPKQWKG